MNETYEYLIGVLEESVRRNGEKPLTNKWLLNILKIAQRQLELYEDGPDIGDNPDF